MLKYETTGRIDGVEKVYKAMHGQIYEGLSSKCLNERGQMGSDRYGTMDANAYGTVKKQVHAHDVRRDRMLAFFVMTTVVLLLVMAMMSIVGISRFNCPKTSPLSEAEAQNHPSEMRSLVDFQNYCRMYMERAAFLYFSGASMTQTTRRLNLKAFGRISLRPKHLTDVSRVEDNIGLNVFGDKVGFPVGISPTAYHKWAHPDGESGTARAAQSLSSVYIASIHSNTAMEDIRKAAPNAILWQQIYIFNDWQLTLDFLKRAENAGYSAIVLTIDKPDDGLFWNHKKGLVSWPEYLKVANFADSSKSNYPTNTTWEGVRLFIKSSTLPVVLKGVTSAEDAKMAIDVGAKGVLVSNHGGRALDFVPATIDLLDEVVAAVDGKIEVFLDGGIRTGPDVFKSLAKGAKMVFIGRPILFGLGYNGRNGVQQVLQILQDEIINTMKLAGTPALVNITLERIGKEDIEVCSLL